MICKLNPGSAVGIVAVLAVVLMLTVGCAGPPPAQPIEPTATRTKAPTATRPATATATEAPTIATVPSDTPAVTAEATEAASSGGGVTFNLPMKGSETAPVTIFEFSDFL
ncbi:MAG: hypothetical protein ACE5F6_08925 [Anaerolineae bacterium]